MSRPVARPADFVGPLEPIAWRMKQRPEVVYPESMRPTDICNFEPIFNEVPPMHFKQLKWTHVAALAEAERGDDLVRENARLMAGLAEIRHLMFSRPDSIADLAGRVLRAKAVCDVLLGPAPSERFG